MNLGSDAKRTQKLQLMVDLDELQAIEDWRYDNRMPSRSAAVRALLLRGLEPATDPTKQAA